MIYDSPCRRVKPPKAEKKEARYLDEVQASELLNCLQNEDIMHRTIITLLLYSGMRRGELCGLKWGDIDFNDKLIHIQRASLYAKGKGVFEDRTKNESSERTIKIAGEALKLLLEYKMYQNTNRIKIADRWQDKDYVFTQWDGKPIHPDSITNWFGKFRKKYNLPDINIHSLRHTNASLLIAAGADLKTVSKRLGHSQLSTTGNIYTHAIKSADERAAETIQDILKPKQKNNKAY